jgi:hypothetical protein
MSEELRRELDKMAMEIDGGISNYMQSEADKRGPADHSQWNWASELHHPCDRFLVYARLNWRDRKSKTVDSLFRLKEGSEQEDKLSDLLAKAGFRLKLGQLPLQWDKFQIRGRIDGAIPTTGRKEYPAEVKSVSPWYWDSTATIGKIREHNKFWINRICSQLNLYLLMKDAPGGFLILVTFGKKPRILPMLLDYELGELDIQQAERVNKLVAKEKLPGRIKYASDICGLCDFDHICQPLQFAEIRDVQEEEVKDLKRFMEIEIYRNEWEKLKKKLIGSKDKPGVFYGANCIVEDIEVSSKQRDQTFYDIPAEIKSKYKDKRTITVTKIGRIG